MSIKSEDKKTDRKDPKDNPNTPNLTVFHFWAFETNMYRETKKELKDVKYSKDPEKHKKSSNMAVYHV